MAVTVGAGYKEPLSNLFTGVVMGIDSSQKKTAEMGYLPTEIKRQEYLTGVYGY